MPDAELFSTKLNMFTNFFKNLKKVEPQQFPLQNDLTYSNYYKLPKIVYDENFNSLILQQKIYLRKTNNINMLDFRFVNLFKQNTVISTG